MRSFILIPPSEGKSAGGEGPAWRPGTGVLPVLDEGRAVVLAAAATTGAVDPAGPTMPAIERYDGVLYRELAAATLPAVARRRLERQLRIASGLWGLSGPADPIPYYKLKMSASLPELGRLSTWWRPRITEALADELRKAIVWDLLPNEHAAGWTPKAVAYRQRITARFIDANGKTVSHWNKLLKGSLVRWLVTTGSTSWEDLDGVELAAGYRLDPDATACDCAEVSLVFRTEG